ncbi:tetratricopeptide repeat protein, partial [Myxococcota bacterium]|nr:tetratricopeptide repeat protein [Myxococcota bacterium]
MKLRRQPDQGIGKLLFSGLFFGLLFGLLSGVGCAPSKTVPHVKVITKVEEPVAIVGQAPDQAEPALPADAEALFHQATEADRRGERARAFSLYAMILDDFSTSLHCYDAHFNLGMLYEEDNDYQAAEPHYRAILDSEEAAYALSSTHRDAHFRLAVNLGKQEKWWEMAAIFDRLLELPELDDDDEIEARLGRGLAIYEAGDKGGAEAAFSRVLFLIRRGGLDSNSRVRGFGAEAALHLGEISRQRFEDVRLLLPKQVFSETLAQKCEYLMEAQGRYIRALRFGDAHTAAVAGLRIGSLYEDLHTAIVEVEVPDDLSSE